MENGNGPSSSEMMSQQNNTEKNASPQEIIKDARDESEAPLKAIEDFADGAEQRTDALLEKIAPAPENANEKNDDVETQSPETLNDIK